MTMKRLFENATVRLSGIMLSLGLAIVLSGCGTPSTIYAGNARDVTTTPRIVAQAPTSATGDMPGMDMPTTVPVTVVPANGAPKATSNDSFVVAWVLFGTPTLSAQAGQQIAALPTGTVAPAQAVKPTQVPTIASTATHAIVTATPAQSRSSGSSAGAGDVAKGKAVFNGVGTCSACHDVANGVQIVGPSLKGVATRAGTRKPGMAALDYLHESIVAPNAFVVPGFAPGIMVQSLAQTLSAQQINDVLAYLMTLK